MFKKKNSAGKLLHPGEVYRNFKCMTTQKWHVAQQIFKKKKRKRRISRLMRKGQHPRRTLRPKAS